MPYILINLNNKISQYQIELNRIRNFLSMKRKNYFKIRMAKMEAKEAREVKAQKEVKAKREPILKFRRFQ